MMNSESQVSLDLRRAFICKSLLGTAALYGVPALAIPPQDDRPGDRVGPIEQRTLNLVNANTWEKLQVIYWKDGKYVNDHVGQLNYLLRDHHVGKSFLMDVKLYDFLYRLYANLDTSESIHILSGYRTSATNKKLRKHSLGVARKSLHVKGRAVDIYIPGLEPNVIQKAARKLMMGGVGYYAAKGFVHLDTGSARFWQRV